MDRFQEPTVREEDYQLAVEQVAEELHEELGREPTDDEIAARLDYYEAELDELIDSMVDDAKLSEDEENE